MTSSKSHLWRKHWKLNQELWWYGHWEVVKGREGGEEVDEQSHQSASAAPNQSFLIRQHCGGPAAAAGFLMLCRHKILMVEETEEGGGEEAGGNPPSEEGEEAPEKRGAENSPQASQGHRQLGYWRPGSCFYWSWCWGGYWCLPHHWVRVHVVGARQVFFKRDPPGVSTCRRASKGREIKRLGRKIQK